MDAGVFVLGMHRSGTSVATRLVNLLGVPTAVEDDLVPAKWDNPTGYWESASLVAFNTELLTSVGSETGCPASLQPGWEHDPRLAELRPPAAEVFRRAFPSAPWVWKDPRNCLTFSFWVSVLDVRPVAILVHRNPLEIAASLRVRNGEDKHHALALWERYLRQALGAISQLPVLITSYEELLSAPLAWCERTRAFFALAGVTTRGSREPDVLAFVDTRMRHSAFTRVDFLSDPAVSDAQRELFGALERLQGEHRRFSAPVLPPETPSTETLMVERRASLQAARAGRGRRLAVPAKAAI